MARAHSIWVIQERHDYEIYHVVAAFTVRHELVTWMKKHNITDSDYQIYKTGDGVWQEKLDTGWLDEPVNLFKPSDFLGE